MSLLELASRIFTVVDVARDATATEDEAEVVDDGGQPVRHKSAGALLGYYSVPPKQGKALSVQTPVGGFLLRFFTDPPAGAVAGEYGFRFGSASLAFKPDESVMLTTSAGTTVTLDVGGNINVKLAAGKTVGIYYNPAFVKAVARNGDALSVNPAWVIWFTTVGTLLGAPPPAAPFGTVVASSTTTKVE